MTAGKETLPRGRGVSLLCILGFLATPVLAGDPPPEQTWTHTLSGEGFSGYAVSVGNRGTQAFCDTGTSTHHTRLYSTLKDTAPSPIWERTATNYCYKQDVDSAEDNDLHVVSRQEVNPSGSDKRVVLEAYRSASPTPLWSYVFPDTVYGGNVNLCRITPDGTRIIGAVTVSTSIHIVVFDPGSGNPSAPIADYMLSLPGGLAALEMSNDGSRAYAANSNEGKVIDVLSGGTIFYKNFSGGRNDGHAFSGDGMTLVCPKYAGHRVWRDQGAGFEEILSSTPFGVYSSEYLPGPAGLSDDGGTLTVTYFEYTAALEAHAFVVDVDTGAELLHDVNLAAVGWQNLPSSVGMTGDGSRVAVGFWGDEAGQAREIVVYQRDESTQLYTTLASFDRPGPIRALDISANGEHLVASGRNADSGGEKVVEVFNLGADLQARGAPRSGQVVTFDFYPEASAHAYLLVAPFAADPPQTFRSGTLYIDRTTLSLLPMGPVLGGKASRDYSLDGVAVGTTLHFQGFGTSSRQLSRNAVPITVLP